MKWESASLPWPFDLTPLGHGHLVKCFGLEKSSKRVKLDGKAAREAQLYGRLPNLWVCIAVFGVEVFVPVGRSSNPWMLSKPLSAQVKAALLALGELPSVPEKGSKRASTCGPRVHVGDPLELSYFAIAWCAIASAQ
jgi:hypothetical protein